ncbi:MAG TPA: PQQ-binding-like beta-propeller repeat protein [Pirellulales bacterium]|nr:PQQ-binding-like beta-propeller repeat protein [Pirellulales bacterium]
MVAWSAPAHAQVVLAAPAAAAEEANPNDPKLPFHLPSQSSDVKEALADFHRYVGKGTWERAFKALDKVQAGHPNALTPRDDGLLMPTRLLLRQALAELPAAGKQAYRLFHDADAKVLLDEAKGKDEVEKLVKIFSSFFITTVGDVAADRLGDIYFEQGDMDQAAECWQAVIQYRPESALPRVRLLVKSAIALARAGRWDAFNEMKRQVHERHAGETVVLGGKPTPAEEHLESLWTARESETTARVAELAAYERDQLPLKQAEWEKSLAAQPVWQLLEPAMLVSTGGAALTRQPDGSILVNGNMPAKDTYTFTAKTELAGITGFRLELLADPSLAAKGPGRAPNGNLVLTELKVTAAPAADESKAQPVALQNAQADYSQYNFPVTASIDDNHQPQNGWAVSPRFGEQHVAVFETTQDVGVTGGTTLVVTLDQQYDQHSIGRFRILVTTSPRPVRLADPPAAVAAILAIAPESRTAEQQAELTKAFRAQDAELARLTALASVVTNNSSDVGDLELPATLDPAWQFRMIGPREAQMLATLGQNWGWGRLPVSEMVPPAVVDGQRAYVNLLGYHLAVDLKTGKLLWRSAKFHDLAQKMQNNPQTHSPEQFNLTVAGDTLWSVFRDVQQMGQQGQPFRIGRWEAATGKPGWNSSTVAELQQWNMMGNPLPIGDRVIVAASKTGQGAEMHLLSLAAADGKLQWSTHLGTSQADQNQWWPPRRSAQPSLIGFGSKVYVDTHAGALVAVDLRTGSLDWGFNYDSEMPDGNNMRWYGMPSETLTTGAPQVVENKLYFKGMQSSRLYCIDLAGPSLAWKREVNKTSMLIGVDGERLYLGGAEVEAIELKTRKLKWSAHVPMATGWIRPVLTDRRVYQFTSRGVYELDKANGDTVRLFRGADLDSLGGTLLVTPQGLLTVSNLSITSYRVGAAAGNPPESASAAGAKP